MRLRLTPRARTDLREIRSWIAADNVKAAEEVIDRIRQTAVFLSKFPRLGRVGRVEGTREFPVTGLPYTLVYQVGAGEIILLTILHQSRKYP